MFKFGLPLLVWIAGTVGGKNDETRVLAGCLTLRISNTDGEHQSGEKKNYENTRIDGLSGSVLNGPQYLDQEKKKN